jgi:uncharacterized protein YndB with AHSA1/START domain
MAKTMTRIHDEIIIDRPVETVFDYVTTPGNWPHWHPSSLSVAGSTGHSLEVGEQVTEDFRVAGRQGQVVWTVTQREAPRRWIIEGQIVGRGAGGTVAYTLTPAGSGTRFVREFSYPTRGLWFRLLNWLLIRQRIAGESTTAVRRLKETLEQEGQRP